MRGVGRVPGTLRPQTASGCSTPIAHCIDMQTNGVKMGDTKEN